jgi:guanylate kinase
VDGLHYIFRTNEEFDELLANDGLLEWNEHFGSRYGTPRKEVEEAVAAGKIVILEIEVEGGMKVKSKREDTVLVFIAPPSMKELKARLKKRGTETNEQIERRLKRVEFEMEQSTSYDYVVINDNLDRAADAVIDILREEQNA